jgi:hypothetical protein
MRNGAPSSIPLGTQFYKYGNVSVRTSRGQGAQRGVPRSGLWSEIPDFASGTGSERAKVASVAERKPPASTCHQEPYADSSPYFRNGQLSFRWGKDWRKREGITMLARGPRPSLLEARLAKLPRAKCPRPLFLLFVGASLGSIPFDFRWEKEWRKREGIEPTGDIAASLPDLKSGGATSAPSASFRMVPPRSHAQGNRSPRARAAENAYFFSASFRRRFLALSFLFLRRRISRFRSVVMSAPLQVRVKNAPPL